MMKAFVAALALGTAAIATPAMAVTTTSQSFASESTDFSQDFGNSRIRTGLFSDSYTFTFDIGGTVDVGVQYFFTVKGITDLSATFGGQKFVFTPTGTPNQFAGGLSQFAVGTGPQTLVVTGTSNGPLASYAGTLQFSAVPEPAAWALMMFGFGAAGTMLRRRGARRTTLAAA